MFRKSKKNNMKYSGSTINSQQNNDHQNNFETCTDHLINPNDYTVKDLNAQISLLKEQNNNLLYLNDFSQYTKYYRDQEDYDQQKNNFDQYRNRIQYEHNKNDALSKRCYNLQELFEGTSLSLKEYQKKQDLLQAELSECKQYIHDLTEKMNNLDEQNFELKDDLTKQQYEHSKFYNCASIENNKNQTIIQNLHNKIHTLKEFLGETEEELKLAQLNNNQIGSEELYNKNALLQEELTKTQQELAQLKEDVENNTRHRDIVKQDYESRIQSLHNDNSALLEQLRKNKASIEIAKNREKNLLIQIDQMILKDSFIQNSFKDMEQTHSDNIDKLNLEIKELKNNELLKDQQLIDHNNTIKSLKDKSNTQFQKISDLNNHIKELENEHEDLQNTYQKEINKKVNDKNTTDLTNKITNLTKQLLVTQNSANTEKQKLKNTLTTQQQTIEKQKNKELESLEMIKKLEADIKKLTNNNTGESSEKDTIQIENTKKEIISMIKDKIETYLMDYTILHNMRTKNDDILFKSQELSNKIQEHDFIKISLEQKIEKLKKNKNIKKNFASQLQYNDELQTKLKTNTQNFKKKEATFFAIKEEAQKICFTNMNINELIVTLKAFNTKNKKIFSYIQVIQSNHNLKPLYLSWINHLCYIYAVYYNNIKEEETQMTIILNLNILLLSYKIMYDWDFITHADFDELYNIGKKTYDDALLGLTLVKQQFKNPEQEKNLLDVKKIKHQVQDIFKDQNLSNDAKIHKIFTQVIDNDTVAFIN